MNALLEPFSYPFMQQALLAGVLIAAVCAVLSCFLVLRGWALMGDAICHAVLPGIAVAYLLGLPLALGAFASGMFCAVGAGWLKNQSRLSESTVMGVAFTGLFALGVVLISRVKTHLHLDHILFGNILGLSPTDFWQTVVICPLVLLIVLLKRRDFLVLCFDPSHARVLGLPVAWLHYGLLALLSLAIVASLQAVGLILVVAMLVAPGAAAHLLADRFGTMLALAVGIAVGSTVLGIAISFWIGASTGSCIVLTQALVFMLCFVLAPKHGVLAQRFRRVRAVGPR